MRNPFASSGLGSSRWFCRVALTYFAGVTLCSGFGQALVYRLLGLGKLLVCSHVLLRDTNYIRIIETA